MWLGGHRGNVSIFPGASASYGRGERSQVHMPVASSSQHQGLAGCAVLIMAGAWL